jgi:hypothetical protein
MDLIDFHIREAPAIFAERFQNTEEQIEYTSNWNAVSGLFTMEGLYSLECLEDGEFLYNGTPINILRSALPKDSTNCNVAIRLSFWSGGSAKVEIRARRVDDDNYIAMEMDFGIDLITIKYKLAGVETVISEINYPFSDEYADFYLVAFGMHEDSIFVMINDYQVHSTFCSYFLSYDGLSINVSGADPYVLTELYYLSIHEVYAHPEPQMEDHLDDLYVMFRKLMKEQVENPPVRDYKSFVDAKTLYQTYKNLGYTDSQWQLLGYPIKEPGTEEWFVESSLVPGILTVSSGDFVNEGFFGGPFSNTKSYTLTNTGTSSLSWEVSTSETWVSLSKTSGSLLSGASDTVIASVNSTANTIAMGHYSSTLSFVNTTTGTGNTVRYAYLYIPVSGTISASVSTAIAPITLIFSAENITSIENIADYSWDFGDSGSSYVATYGAFTGQSVNGRYDYGPLVAHRFQNPGTYTILLTCVTDSGHVVTSIPISLTTTAFSGTTFYVKTGGSDAASGLSDGAAWLTLDKVVAEMATGLIKKGDEVVFKKGNIFTGNVDIYTCYGTVGEPVFIGAYGTGANPEFRQSGPGIDAIINFRDMTTGSSIVFDSIYFRRTAWPGAGAAVLLAGASGIKTSNIVFRSCEIVGGYDGISFTDGASLIIEDCSIHNSPHVGLKSSVSNTLVRNSNIYSNGTSTTLDHNIQLFTTDNCVIQGNNIRNGAACGIMINGTCNKIKIRRNNIYANDTGIRIIGGFGSTERFIRMRIESNNIYSNTNIGIYVGSVQNSFIINNNVYNNSTINGNINVASGSAEDYYTTELVVANNNIYGTGIGLVSNLTQATSDFVFKNNIVYYSGSDLSRYCIYVPASTGVLTSDNNVFYSPVQSNPFYISSTGLTFAQWQALAYDANGVYGDPLFTNADGGIFTLQAGSPGINSAELMWQVYRDFNLSARGTVPDCGAYET